VLLCERVSGQAIRAGQAPYDHRSRPQWQVHLHRVWDKEVTFYEMATQVLIVEYIILAVIAACGKQYGSFIYWIAAAVLTVGVILMPKWG
jgi:hypothetical protein